MSTPSANPPVKFARIVLQDFQHFSNYLPDQLWQLLVSKEAPHQQKLESLVDHALKLGMRYPSEPSIKFLTAMHHTYGWHRRSRVYGSSKQVQLLRLREAVFEARNSKSVSTF